MRLLLAASLAAVVPTRHTIGRPSFTSRQRIEERLFGERANEDQNPKSQRVNRITFPHTDLWRNPCKLVRTDTTLDQKKRGLEPDSAAKNKLKHDAMKDTQDVMMLMDMHTYTHTHIKWEMKWTKKCCNFCLTFKSCRKYGFPMSAGAGPRSGLCQATGPHAHRH